MNLVEIFTEGSLQFSWPWVFALLPLPWLLRMLLPTASERSEAALRVPYPDDFNQASRQNTSRLSRLPMLLFTLGWLCLLLAASRPQHVGDAIELPVSGRDLMLAIDLSGSMETKDFVIRGKAIDRLTATKLVASDFIERRVGDRIGLILFGRQAYLQSPLTFDRVTVKTLLQESFLGLAGRETAIGDAIGLALKRLRQVQQDETSEKVLILLTDGDNTAGTIQPRKAAELAARENMKVYTIGIGSNRGSRRMGSILSRGNYAEIDEKTLKYVADTTGGRYFRATNTRELIEIYSVLDELEPAERDTQSYRPTRALYYWPLGIALFIAMLFAVMRSR